MGNNISFDSSVADVVQVLTRVTDVFMIVSDDSCGDIEAKIKGKSDWAPTAEFSLAICHGITANVSSFQ